MRLTADAVMPDKLPTSSSILAEQFGQSRPFNKNVFSMLSTSFLPVGISLFVHVFPRHIEESPYVIVG